MDPAGRVASLDGGNGCRSEADEGDDTEDGGDDTATHGGLGHFYDLRAFLAAHAVTHGHTK